MKKRYLLLPAALTLFAASAPANAFTLLNYSLDDPGAFNAGVVNGYGYYDGPIGFHTDTAGDFETYCVDLNHFLQAGKSYHFGLLTTDGLGNPISELQSYEIGKIATAGFANISDQNFAAAAQLAIWAIEYNTTASGFANPTIQNDYLSDVAFAAPSASELRWAKVVIPDSPWPEGGEWGSSQQMVVGLAAVPEPSTWAMGIIGFGFVSLLGLTRTRKGARAIA